MANPDDLHAVQQAALSVQDMRDALSQPRPTADADDITDRIAPTEARLEGFYWVILGQNPLEIAYWERGEWWLEAVTVVSDRLVFKPRLARWRDGPRQVTETKRRGKSNGTGNNFVAHNRRSGRLAGR